MDGFALVDVPRTGAANMAIDQRMLEYAAGHGRPILRVYQWAEPTLTLGYFQKYASREEHAASRTLPVVRRSTGGGAIVHHHDWTYSVALPGQLLPSASGAGGNALGPALSVYDWIHDAVVDWLGELGWAAHKWEEDCRVESDKAPASCSFLCFQRRSPGDVIVGDSKVLGSAQRRYKGAVLQHGSLLKSKSPYAPNLTGLLELTGDTVRMDANALRTGISRGAVATEKASVSWDSGDFLTRIASALETCLGRKLRPVDSIENVPSMASDNYLGKYVENSWTRRV